MSPTLLVTGLIEFFKIIPSLFILMARFGLWVKANASQEFINDVSKTMDDLEQAETSKQRFAVARSMVNLVRRLR